MIVAVRRRVARPVMLATLILVAVSVPSAGGSAAPPVPGGPPAALSETVSSLAEGRGVRLAPGPALAVARLDPRLAGRLTTILSTLRDCGDASAVLINGLPAPPGRMLAAGVALRQPPKGTEAVAACAERLQGEALALDRFLADEPPGMGSDVSLWPVLRLDLDGSDDTVAYDYMLSVDTGGNDLYLNNAGGNLIDVRRGPPGSGAESIGPARGCINPAYDLLAGECVISEALLVDVAGDDTYGRMEAPDPGLDGLCTADPLMRRVITAGVGLAGVGVLVEGSGNDTYVGKSITEGAGHIGGTGILLDLAGDDHYRAMRLAKGFGTLFGTGIFHDFGGDDTYSRYMPRPLDPNAADRTLGAGGGLDTGGTCDRIARYEEGTGFVGGVGIFLDDAGDDDYGAAPPVSHEPGATGFIRQTGSLGFGDAGGFGLFLDGSGADRYAGMPGRADGVTVVPSDASQGFFHDEGGERASRSASGSPVPGGAFTAWFTHYIPDTVTIAQGGTLTFLNVDPYGGPLGGRAHTITELRPDGPPRFDVFVPWATAAEIGGTESLPPGQYSFTCRIHPFMKGTLVVR